MSELYGSAVKDPNFRLRFFLIVFAGVITWGAVNFWKGELLFAAEYQEFPVTHEQIRIKKENKEIKNKLFKNYQLEE
jgi:hypothetical protein